MVCPKCAGASTQCKPVGHEWGVYEVGPCPECQGSGIVSCCDTAGASDVMKDHVYRSGAYYVVEKWVEKIPGTFRKLPPLFLKDPPPQNGDRREIDDLPIDPLFTQGRSN